MSARTQVGAASQLNTWVSLWLVSAIADAHCPSLTGPARGLLEPRPVIQSGVPIRNGLIPSGHRGGRRFAAR